ncbi:unnamed protein product [Diatraea saccharalis]|uniref:Uncharacterized protein n=1 Tax=Diatraea saccharalis TaxID=40085 RepID=A0A9N9RBV3_9NEOP|nr:unnamed protein product [Diatraea saccharalis]
MVLEPDGLKSDNNITSQLNLSSTKAGEIHVDLIIWTLVGTGIIIIIILIIIMIKVCSSKKTGITKNQEDVTYENLCNESGTPTTFPRSARLEETYLRPSDCRESPYANLTADNETYALPYVEKNIENLYSKPVSKSERGKVAHSKTSLTAAKRTEPVYAEIDVDPKIFNKNVNTAIEYATVVTQSQD